MLCLMLTVPCGNYTIWACCHLAVRACCVNWNLVPGVSCGDVKLKHGITVKALEVWAQVEKRGSRIMNK